MRRHGRLRCAAQHGTTLIEVMVAILLLSVGLLGMVGLQARTVQTSVDAENRASAALLANELITAMWLTHDATNNPYVSAAFNQWQAVASRALPSGAYTLSAPDASGAVRLRITWVAPGQQSAGAAVTSQYITTVSIP